MRRLLRWLRFGRVEHREHLTLITTPAGVYAVEDGIPHCAFADPRWGEVQGCCGEESPCPATGRLVVTDHEPPSLYDWEREGL